MEEKNEKQKIWETLYDSTIVIHTVVTAYLVIIFFLAVTNSWESMPDFRSANLFIFFGILGSQLVRKLNCPLTELQNWLADKLRRKRIKRFHAYLLKKCGISIHYQVLDVIHIALIACIFVSYIIY